MDRICKTIKFPSQIVPRSDRDPPLEVVPSEVAREFKKQPKDEERYELDGKA